MAAIPFALSIHHFINSVGADVGFASIIGLALLVLLFFTQARETANLRRRADYAETQLEALHAYMDQLSRTPAPTPAPAPVTAPVAAPPLAARIAARPVAAPVASQAVAEPVPVGAVATIPSAPAGVGAPALSAATRLIPVGDDDPISIRALKPGGNGQIANGGSPEPGTAVVTPAPPPPSTAAGGNGAPPVAPPPSLEGRPANGAVAPPPRVSLRPQGAPPSRPAPPPLRRTAAAPRRRLNPVALVLLIALVVAVIVVGVLVLANSGSSNAPTSSSSSAASRTTAAKTSGRHKRRGTAPAAAQVAPSTVAVAVLNGTDTSHLAADVLGKLTAAGYKGGPTANAAESGVTATIVGYTEPAYRNDALAVATSLHLGTGSVRAVSAGDRSAAAAACTTSTACPPQVVVTLGSDLASAA
jgi:preprotein translocase subunit SecG